MPVGRADLASPTRRPAASRVGIVAEKSLACRKESLRWWGGCGYADAGSEVCPAGQRRDGVKREGRRSGAKTVGFRVNPGGSRSRSSHEMVSLAPSPAQACLSRYTVGRSIIFGSDNSHSQQTPSLSLRPRSGLQTEAETEAYPSSRAPAGTQMHPSYQEVLKARGGGMRSAPIAW